MRLLISRRPKRRSRSSRGYTRQIREDGTAVRNLRAVVLLVLRVSKLHLAVRIWEARLPDGCHAVDVRNKSGPSLAAFAPAQKGIVETRRVKERSWWEPARQFARDEPESGSFPEACTSA